MPDQYVLSALQRLELAKRHRPPLFAEVDLISSHAPWTRIPRLIPWDDVGDGSIFHRVPVEESTRAKLFGDAKRARAAYGHSIEYTMSTIVSFVQHYGNDKTVVVLLGDHQPATTVSGQGATHDVPISIIAHDPKVTGTRSPDGTGRTACARARRRPSGRWRPSATASSPRSARRRRAADPVPRGQRGRDRRGRGVHAQGVPAAVRRGGRRAAGRVGVGDGAARRAPAGTGGAATPRSATS